MYYYIIDVIMKGEFLAKEDSMVYYCHTLSLVYMEVG